jgi:hypothetical protein
MAVAVYRVVDESRRPATGARASGAANTGTARSQSAKAL